MTPPSPGWPLEAFGPESFRGKAAIVTGASRGIGAITALGLARLGAKVVCSARDERQLDELVATISSEGGRAMAVVADVRDEASIANLVERTVDGYGRLDLAFNNAGMPMIGDIVDADVHDFDVTIETNLRSVFLCLKHEIRAMIDGGHGGAIVNCSSAAGHLGRPGGAIYSASKWGVIGLSKSAALECTDRTIRVNVLSPGLTLTPGAAVAYSSDDALETMVKGLVPLGRLSLEEEQAGAAIWLLSNAAAYLTGAVLNVDGGLTAGLNPGGPRRPRVGFAHSDSATQ
jgi:NAD(P)-dependent dehydrogenase (short-subunit alcohol dehydrogenase family)